MGSNRDARRLAASLLLAGGLLAPGAARGDVASLSEKVSEDANVGYSIQAIRGWEPSPRKNPDDPTANCEVGGWYSKERDDRNPREPRATCNVLAFGTFFHEESRAVATPVAPVPGESPPPGEPGGKEGGGGTAPEPPKEGEKKDGKEAPKPPQSLQDLFGKPPASFDEWLAKVKEWTRGRITWSLTPTKAKFGSDEGFTYEGMMRFGSSANILTAASVRRGSFEVAVLYSAPDDKNYVRDFKGAFKASVRSLRILPEGRMRKSREAMEKKVAAAGGEEAAWAERVIASLPKGWTHLRTDHYVIVYDTSLEEAPPPKGCPGLVARIGRQLEAIRRDVYEPLFPADRPVTAISVVKVTQDPVQYYSYGAPQGSGGYWSWPSRELVFPYFPRTDGSRAGFDLTLDVLNHEGFHQYIFYAVGQVAPHSWFNEGHGDFFAGYNLFEGKFRPGKFAMRSERIKQAIDGGTIVPLRDFLKYSQPEYYRRGGNPAKGEDVLQNYAQGWSLIYFLRTTKDPRYQGILDRYFNTLKAAVTSWKAAEEEAAKRENRKPLPTFLFPPDLNQKAKDDALRIGFDGVDIDQLERDWLASKPY